MLKKILDRLTKYRIATLSSAMTSRKRPSGLLPNKENKGQKEK